MSGGISVIVTVRQDRQALERLLAALRAQTRPPDELVIVDGGSTDGTVEMLRAVRDEPFALRVEVAEEANISTGRNLAIRLAAHDWIACTDAGCVPEPGWLEAIDGRRRDARFIAGFYIVEAHNPFEEALAVSLYPVPEEVGDERPLVRLAHRLFGRSFDVADGTGRSMAFHRSAWEAVGGFDEGLYAGEDVAFSTAVVEAGVPAAFEPRAVVHWRPRASLGANARMYRTYGRGGVRTSNIKRHLARGVGWVFGIALVARARPATIALAALGTGAYLGLPLARARRRGRLAALWWRIPVVAAMKDLSLMHGAAVGTVDQVRGRAQPRAERPPAG